MERRRRLYLKTTPDRLMMQVVQSAGAKWYGDLSKLTPQNLPYFIDELREGEASARLLRQQLEALQAGQQPRTCAYAACDRPVFGRADKLYCTTECRVRAHRRQWVGEDGDGIES